MDEAGVETDAGLHPDHEVEQAYLRRARAALVAMVARSERGPSISYLSSAASRMSITLRHIQDGPGTGGNDNWWYERVSPGGGFAEA